MRFALVIGVVIVSTLSTRSLAQAPAPEAAVASPAPAPAPTPGSDIVRLSSGGFMRGTITEFVPGDYVVILTSSGESKRFLAAEVSYAGPVAEDPATLGATPEIPAQAAVAPVAQPAVETRAEAPAPSEAHFEFVGREPGLTLHLVTGSEIKKRGEALSSFKPLCAAPCAASVAFGAHTFAVSQAALLPVTAPNTLDLKGGETVEASYESRRSLRTLGKILFCVSIAVGIGVVIGDIARSPHDPKEGPLIGGLLVAIGGGLGGALLAMQSDRTSLTVTGKK